MADIVKLIYKWDEMAQWGGSSSATLKVMDFQQSWPWTAAWQDVTFTFNSPYDGFIDLHRQERYESWSKVIYLDSIWVTNSEPRLEIQWLSWDFSIWITDYVPVKKWTNTFVLKNNTEDRPNNLFCNHLWYIE